MSTDLGSVRLLEVEHDGVHRVVLSSEAGEEDSVQVELEDGDGNVHKEFVRGGGIREHSERVIGVQVRVGWKVS